MIFIFEMPKMRITKTKYIMIVRLKMIVAIAYSMFQSNSDNNENIGLVTFGKLRKSALAEVLLFCANAPDNFLERELSMKKRGKWGITFPHLFSSKVHNKFK